MSYQNKTKHNKDIKLQNKTKKSSYQNKTKNWTYQNKTKKLSYQNKTKQNTTKPEPYAQCCGCRDHFAYALSQWEIMLQCNIVSHWLDANTKWSLGLCHISSLQWRHKGRDGISNCQPPHCLLNRLFRHRSKKASKLRVTGLCVWNSPVTGEFPAQMASNAGIVSIRWRHHAWRIANESSQVFGRNTISGPSTYSNGVSNIVHGIMVKTATNLNGHNRNGHNPKRPQTETATNRNGHTPKRPQSSMTTVTYGPSHT